MVCPITQGDHKQVRISEGMSPRGITDKFRNAPTKSVRDGHCRKLVGLLRKSGPKYQNPFFHRCLTVPNFIALGQTMYEKIITIFTPFSILALQTDSLGQSSPISALM